MKGYSMFPKAPSGASPSDGSTAPADWADRPRMCYYIWFDMYIVGVYVLYESRRVS